MENETQVGSYLSLLEASLEKKCELLDSLCEASKNQDALFNEKSLNEEQFDRIIEEKDKLIKLVLQLDEGFEQLYQRVKDVLATSPNTHQKEIMKLKELVTMVTNKSVQLQVIEKRNKTKIDEYFRAKRKDIKDFKKSNQSATSYYKNMADQNQQQAYFFDKKK